MPDEDITVIVAEDTLTLTVTDDALAVTVDNDNIEVTIGELPPPDWTQVHGIGLLAARPTASAANNGYTYVATDVEGGTLYRSNGTTWVAIAAGVAAEVRGLYEDTVPHLGDGLYVPTWLVGEGDIRSVYAEGEGSGYAFLGDPNVSGAAPSTHVHIERELLTFAGFYDNTLVYINNLYGNNTPGTGATALWARSESSRVAAAGTSQPLFIFEAPYARGEPIVGVFAPTDLSLADTRFLAFSTKSGDGMHLYARDGYTMGAASFTYAKRLIIFSGGKISAAAVATTQTGTIAKATGSQTTFTGTGTAFLSEFAAGDVIAVRNAGDTAWENYRQVVSIASNTAITFEPAITGGAYSGRKVGKVAADQYRPPLRRLEHPDAIHRLASITTDPYWSAEFIGQAGKERIKFGPVDPTGDTDYHVSRIFATKPTTAVTVANTTTETTLAQQTNQSRRRWFTDVAVARLHAHGVLTKNATGDLEFILYPADASAPGTIRLLIADGDLANSATPRRWVVEGEICADSSGVAQFGWLRVTIADGTTNDVVIDRMLDTTTWTENMTSSDLSVVSSHNFRAKWSAVSASLSLTCRRAYFLEAA